MRCAFHITVPIADYGLMHGAMQWGAESPIVRLKDDPQDDTDPPVRIWRIVPEANTKWSRSKVRRSRRGPISNPVRQKHKEYGVSDDLDLSAGGGRRSPGGAFDPSVELCQCTTYFTRWSWWGPASRRRISILLSQLW